MDLFDIRNEYKDAITVSREEMRPGDLIFLRRKAYWHVEVYVGANQSWGSSGLYKLFSGNVQTFKDIAYLDKEEGWVILRLPGADNDETRIRGRCDMQRKQPYNLLRNNCEHYALRAIGLTARSKQAESVTFGLATCVTLMALFEPDVAVVAILSVAPLCIFDQANIIMIVLLSLLGVWLARYYVRQTNSKVH